MWEKGRGAKKNAQCNRNKKGEKVNKNEQIQ